MSDGLGALVERLAGRRITLLTGAGCSTESGIPDYRGPTAHARRKAPVQYREFVTSEAARRRYWARAVVGWPRFSATRPNAGHAALARLEAGGAAIGLITQNVDGLHHAAGSRRVIELHGRLARVRCLSCGHREPRQAVQERLLDLNPAWADRRAALAPDGDAELPATLVDGFRVAACLACAGPLKPDVVFFGETVPRPIVEASYAMVEEGEALLVVGSSLTVFSGFRFVRRAADRGLPVAIVNLGPTRGDPWASVKVEGRAGEVLPRLTDALLAQKRSRPQTALPMKS